MTASLVGERVLVTRPAHQAAGLVKALTAQGADVTAIPLIRIVGLNDADGPDPAPVKQWFASLTEQASAPGWLVITSANGVGQLAAAARRWGGGVGSLRPFRIAAVGPATAARLTEDRLVPELVPLVHTGEALAAALVPQLRADDTVTLARGDLASPGLPERLRETGATVTELTVYRTVADAEGGEAVRHALQAGAVDTIVFTSPSTVQACLTACGASAARLLGSVRRAAIGPVTAAALAEAGLPANIVPASATAAALAVALMS